MARRRMFSLDIIDTDHFLDMPSSTQNLYFHLGLRADDEGFVASPKRIAKNVSATDDDMRILMTKGFIIPFESGVCVVTHWKTHNYIQNDRSKPTIYSSERSKLESVDGSYLLIDDRIQNGYKPDTQDRLGKDRLGKDNNTAVRPTLEEVESYCKERNNKVDPQKWFDHYTSNGWRVGRNAMKDWKAAVRTWERSDFNSTPSAEKAMTDAERLAIIEANRANRMAQS